MSEPPRDEGTGENAFCLRGYWVPRVAPWHASAKGATVSEKSAIEWTDATWNPVTGCTKVSPACANSGESSLLHRREQVHHKNGDKTENAPASQKRRDGVRKRSPVDAIVRPPFHAGLRSPKPTTPIRNSLPT